MSDPKEIGRRVAVLRDKSGLSQVELAKRLNVSPSTIAMWELGEREIKSSILARIAEFFNVDADYLLNRTNDPTPSKADASDTTSPEQQEFLKWVEENLEGTFFYDFDKSPEDSKKYMMETLRMVWKREKDRKPGQKQSE